MFSILLALQATTIGETNNHRRLRTDEQMDQRHYPGH
jgi:hypothetical protein